MVKGNLQGPLARIGLFRKDMAERHQELAAPGKNPEKSGARLVSHSRFREHPFSIVALVCLSS